jgi:hypothetical protein
MVSVKDKMGRGVLGLLLGQLLALRLLEDGERVNRMAEVTWGPIFDIW